MTAKEEKVTLYGQKEALKKLSSLTLNVDLTGVKASTTQTIKLPVPDGIAWVDPASVSVKIDVSDSSD